MREHEPRFQAFPACAHGNKGKAGKAWTETPRDIDLRLYQPTSMSCDVSMSRDVSAQAFPAFPLLFNFTFFVRSSGEGLEPRLREHTFSSHFRKSIKFEERERVDKVECAEHALTKRPGSPLHRQSLGERKHQQNYVEEGEGEGKECWVLERRKSALYACTLAPHGEEGSDRRTQQKPDREGNTNHSLLGRDKVK